MIRETTFDVETTTFQKGNPFSKRNRLCSVGMLLDGGYIDFPIEHGNDPYGSHLRAIQQIIRETELLIGFNLKFDIHWLRRYGINITCSAVWDCQLAHFILHQQQTPYPSLDDALAEYGLPKKLDRVKNEFWERGIDTPEIPWEILAEYQEADVRKTYDVYLKQKEQFENGDPRLYELFKLQCKDLLILEDMEFFGMKMDVDLAKRKVDELGKELNEIDQELADLGDGRINWGSPDHISVFLYGGTITFKCREQVQRTLKNGTVKHYERWGTTDVQFPRLVKPDDRNEQAATRGKSDEELQRINAEKIKSGHRPLQRLYSVDEQSLRSIKGTGKVKRVVGLLLRRAELEKLYGTYYKGLSDLIEEMDWPEGELHGQFNQCVVVTGRLSSSKPNLQNLAGESKALYVSRY